MKELKCRNLGNNCKFVSRGRTDGSTKKKMMEHGMKAHPIKMKRMTKTQMKAMGKKMDMLLSK